MTDSLSRTVAAVQQKSLSRPHNLWLYSINTLSCGTRKDSMNIWVPTVKTMYDRLFLRIIWLLEYLSAVIALILFNRPLRATHCSHLTHSSLRIGLRSLLDLLRNTERAPFEYILADK